MPNTTQEKLNKNKEYSRQFRAIKRKFRKAKSSITPLVPYHYPLNKITATPLTGTELNCRTFGCGRKLSPREALFGNVCIKCQ